MLAIKEYNADRSKVAPEKVVAAYKLKTRMFRDIAIVLEVVDSVGAGWLVCIQASGQCSEENIKQWSGGSQGAVTIREMQGTVPMGGRVVGMAQEHVIE